MTNSMQAAPQATTHPAAPQAEAAELREQIKQSILAAQDGARDAALARAQVGRGGRPVIIGPNGPFPASPLPPGSTFQVQESFPGDGFPPQVVDISIAFFIMCAVMVIGWPLARAFGRRLEGRGAPPAVSAGTAEQLNRIEQAVDAMAIEVERISESQRFIAKLQNAQSPNRELKSS